MLLKGKYTKCTQRSRKLTLLAYLVVVFALSSATAHAQQTVKRFILVNNVLMPFYTQIAPSFASSMSVTVQNPYKAIIGWSASANTTEYRLEQLNAATSEWNVIYQGSNLTYTTQSLSIGVHSFRLTVCGGGLCSDPGAVENVTIDQLPDTDLDQVYDYEDTCPATPLGEIVDADGCSVNQLTDTDGDDVVDAYDVCPGNAAGDDVNVVGCTLDQDSDGDGLIDRVDGYPFQHNTQCTG